MSLTYFIHLPMQMEPIRGPKRRILKLRRRGITQNGTYYKYIMLDMGCPGPELSISNEKLMTRAMAIIAIFNVTNARICIQEKLLVGEIF
jgi:hypothetical protein